MRCPLLTSTVFTFETFLISVFASPDLNCDVENTPFVMEQDLHIFCELLDSSICIKDVEQNRAWFHESKTVLFLGRPPNISTRYTESQITCNKTVLKVANFSEIDMMTKFRCSVGHMDCFVYISEDTIRPEYHPKQNDIITNLNSSLYSLSAKVDFLKVTPLPNCTLEGKENIRTPTKVNFTKDGLYYKTEYVFRYEFEPEECQFDIVINCLVGTTLLTINETVKRCSESTEALELPTTWFEVVQLVTAPAILILISCSFYRNWPCIRKLIKERQKRDCWAWRRPLLAIFLTVICVVAAIIDGTITTELVTGVETTEIPKNMGLGFFITSFTMTPLALGFLSNPETEGIREGLKKALENLKKKIMHCHYCRQHEELYTGQKEDKDQRHGLMN